MPSVRVRASIREIVPAPSFELTTHTQSSEAATSVGVLPTDVTDVSSSDTGSTAPTEFGVASSAALRAERHGEDDRDDGRCKRAPHRPRAGDPRSVAGVG